MTCWSLYFSCRVQSLPVFLPIPKCCQEYFEDIKKCYLKNINVWQYKNNLQCQSHDLLPFTIFILWTYLIIKMHNHHLNCTSKITVFCFLFSFFHRCIFLRLLFCKAKAPGLLVYCLKMKFLLSVTILSNIFRSFKIFCMKVLKDYHLPTFVPTY